MKTASNKPKNYIIRIFTRYLSSRVGSIILLLSSSITLNSLMMSSAGNLPRSHRISAENCVLKYHD